jgi:hypothetical protein
VYPSFNVDETKGLNATCEFTGSLDLTNNALLSTAASNAGNAGNLTIQANDDVTVQSGSQITSRSTGTGFGGTVGIGARSLFLNQDAQINASTVSSDGGNWVLNFAEMLQLRDRSLLNAEAGHNQPMYNHL